MMVVGLWLTPFYLRVLGTHDYGVWLVALQVLTFLLLADLGVLAVTPRDVAREHGRELTEPQSNGLRIIVGQTSKLVTLQTLFVGLAALGLFFFRVRAVSSLEGPVGLVLIVFVVTYPLRLYPSVLLGLQDLKFLGQIRIGLWSIATAIIVILLLMGARFYALAAGWCIQELGSDVAGFWRLRRIRPDLVGFKPWKLAGSLQWRWFTRGLWVSVSQVSVWLVAGSDLLIIAHALGAATVVIYSCTCKLVLVLQNQPQILAGVALPGLSQMKISESRERTIKATVGLTQGMVFVAGGVFTIVLALNQNFVGLWVGAKFFGGMALTVLVVANFLVRLIAYTLSLALFAFGYEKISAIRFLLDAVVSVVIAIALLGLLGMPGVVAGYLSGALLVGIPFDIYFLARELQISPLDVVRPYVPYLWRCGAVGAAGYLVMQRIEIPNLLALAVAAAAVGIVYLLVTLPMVLRSELGDYLRTAFRTFQASKQGRVLGWLNNW